MGGMIFTLVQLKTGIKETDSIITKINRIVVSIPVLDNLTPNLIFLVTS